MCGGRSLREMAVEFNRLHSERALITFSYVYKVWPFLLPGDSDRCCLSEYASWRDITQCHEQGRLFSGMVSTWETVILPVPACQLGSWLIWAISWPVEWPARSSDLTSLDFYICSHWESLVYMWRRFSARWRVFTSNTCHHSTCSTELDGMDAIMRGTQ